VAQVVDNPDQSRFELLDEGRLLGWADYRPAGASVIVAHTEIVRGHEGEGLAGELLRGALEAIAERGQTVIPTCPFAAAYIRRHPEHVDLVVPSMQPQFR